MKSICISMYSFNMHLNRQLSFARVIILCCIFYRIFLLYPSSAGVTFKNIECFSFDKTFANFRHCYLSVPLRRTIAVTVYVELYKIPVNNVTINMALLKKANGYRPFLYNYTMDFCKMMATKKMNSFVKIIVDAIRTFSNVNHTCPYDHDIIIDKMVLGETQFKLIPLPAGEYLIDVSVGAYNHWKANVRFYGVIDLKL